MLKGPGTHLPQTLLCASREGPGPSGAQLCQGLMNSMPGDSSGVSMRGQSPKVSYQARSPRPQPRQALGKPSPSFQRPM